MRYKNALKRSAVILVILTLSVLLGFLYQFICDRIDRANYPKEYSEYVEMYSQKYSVPEHIVYSVMKVESGFDSGAKSDAGAVGLMQLMPDTFKAMMIELREEYNPDLIYGPETNIRVGTYYLSKLYRKYGNWNTVFAAYNGGETKVDGWLKDKTYSEDGIKLKDIPFPETEKYVAKVNRAMETYLRLYY